MNLSDEQKTGFKQALEQRRRELEEVSKTATEAAATVELDQQKVGRLSRMDALQAQAMSIETNRRRQLEMQRIQTALQRLDNAEYGICVSCDEGISLQRLQINPATPVCIDCAGKLE